MFGYNHFYSHSFQAYWHNFPQVTKLTTWRLEQFCQFDTDHVIMCHGTYKWTDAINASPVRMDFSVIAQRTAKDNLSLNLISTQRWWALFWLAWLTVGVHLGLLGPNVISRAVSACTCACECVCICQFRSLWTPLWDLYIIVFTPRTKCECECVCEHVNRQVCACLYAHAGILLSSHMYKLWRRPCFKNRYRANI